MLAGLGTPDYVAEGMDPLPPVTRVDNPQYPHGSNHFHEGFSDLRFDPHFPVVYGRVENMVFGRCGGS